jgi:adenylate kinase
MLGAPGAGKGTQAALLAQRLERAHVATGDLFRAAVREGTPLGHEAQKFMERGQLVPDDITISMLLDRMDQPDAANGAILDGFPRNRAQAEALDTALAERSAKVDHAVEIRVPSDEVVRRLSGRWVCRDAGHPYNQDTNPPREAGRCDIDGSPLVQRDDDKPETVRARLEIQLASLGEVLAHYANRGILRTVDGTRSIDDVAEDVVAVVTAGSSSA